MIAGAPRSTVQSGRHRVRLKDTRDPEGSMRKYILNGAMLSAVFGAFGAIQATRKGPRDWRLVLAWVSWGISVALAVGSVQTEAEKADELEE
jgi:hypothetical protein